jgi:hypothetical protein
LGGGSPPTRGVWGAEAPQGAKNNIKYRPKASYENKSNTNMKSTRDKLEIDWTRQAEQTGNSVGLQVRGKTKPGPGR